MKLTITGYSTALFSTWYFIDEWGLLFDAGDGVSSGLLSKARKVKDAFISHADRDHLTGLPQFTELNAREGLKIYYPKDSGSFPAMQQFLEKFDPHIAHSEWVPIGPDIDWPIRNGRFVHPIRNNHVPAAADIFKSFSYVVYEEKNKLKPEFSQLSGREIRDLREQKGKDYITETVKTNLLAFSGDTPVENDGRWNNIPILIHEATFLEKIEKETITTHGNKHSTLEEVLEMVAQTNIETLILGHFSIRYADEQIDETIKRLCTRFGINIPVFRVLPGKLHADILNSRPVWGG